MGPRANRIQKTRPCRGRKSEVGEEGTCSLLRPGRLGLRDLPDSLENDVVVGRAHPREHLTAHGSWAVDGGPDPDFPVIGEPLQGSYRTILDRSGQSVFLALGLVLIR